MVFCHSFNILDYKLLNNRKKVRSLIFLFACLAHLKQRENPHIALYCSQPPSIKHRLCHDSSRM